MRTERDVELIAENAADCAEIARTIRHEADGRNDSAFGALAAAVLCRAPVAAQPAPDTQGGRFSFTPVRDGLMRLDVRTGQVSMCKADNNGWTCDITPDERTAFDTEIGRLNAEMARLKSELASRSTSASDASKLKLPRLKLQRPKLRKQK